MENPCNFHQKRFTSQTKKELKRRLTEKMAKKLLCVIVLMISLACVLASCDNAPSTTAPNTTEAPTHTHAFGEWVTTKEKTCTEDGIEERVCSCGKKDTVTITAGHNYAKGICTKCSRGLINIILPETPITVHDYSGSNINVTIKMTSLEIGDIGKNYDGTYDIIFYWAGEKIYDRSGNSHSSRCRFGYKLYDSEGFVVHSNSTSSTAVSVGEKFKDQEFGPSWLKLDPNETYTLEILNVS